MSGAGRSAAADVLEDLGFFVIDNLPPALIPKVAELGAAARQSQPFALVVDVRSGEFIDDLEAALASCANSGARTRVFFLDAADDVLVRRFDETRRRHPLAADDRVSEGIAQERRLLDELKGEADVVVDTSDLNVHELRDRLRELFGERPTPKARCRSASCRSATSTGSRSTSTSCSTAGSCPTRTGSTRCGRSRARDPSVREYVLGQPEAQAFLEELQRLFELCCCRRSSARASRTCRSASGARAVATAAS